MAKIKHFSQNGLQEKAIERAKKYIADENYVDAKDEIEKILDVNPSDDRALNLLAIVMLKLEQFNKAIKIYEDLITRYPQTAALHMNLGVAYLKNNQYENAAKEFSFVLQKEPDNKTALKLSGKALLKLNRTEEAIEMFEKAGMDEYARKIKGSETGESVESELSTDEIMEESQKRSKEEEQIKKEEQINTEEQIITEEQPGGSTTNETVSEETIHEEEKDVVTRENVEENLKEQKNELSSTDEHNEQEIIETERGPSATDEQELIEAYSNTSEEQEKEELSQYEEQTIVHDESVKEEQKEIEQQSPQQTELQKDVEEFEEKGEAVQEQKISTKQAPEETLEKVQEETTEGLDYIAEKISLSKYNAPTTFINNSLLLFNLNGNIVYIRDKGIIALSEGLSMEQAYKRYRGKDTKSIFAEKKDDPVVLIYGKGMLLFKTEFNNINELILKNEVMFLNDERLLAFHGDLEWENGRVEVRPDKSVNVTQMRGTASIFVGLHNILHSIEVNTDRYISVRMDTLIGWQGKLIPRQTALKHYNNIDYMAFYGEGVVFIDA